MKKRYNVKIDELLHKAGVDIAKKMTKTEKRFISFSSLIENGLEYIIRKNGKWKN